MLRIHVRQGTLVCINHPPARISPETIFLKLVQQTTRTGTERFSLTQARERTIGMRVRVARHNIAISRAYFRSRSLISKSTEH